MDDARMDTVHTRADAERLDAQDPLAALRERFHVPDGMVYLDGNSLGALPRTVPARLAEVVEREWGEGLVRSWGDAGWWDASERVAAALAPLLGAGPDEVFVADSTSVDTFKLLVVAARLQPGRGTLVAERYAFPTDVYIATATAELLGLRLRLIDGPDELESTLDDTVAAVLLSHVDFRTGAMWDARATTAQVHEHGALMFWDLCHSTGAVPVDLPGWDADLAVGCGYKYLNGGPGAPAYGYVARRHHAGIRTPLPGWHGHATPFGMRPEYVPSAGVGQLRGGTPPILSLTGLAEGVATLSDVDIHELRAKSVRLSTLLVDLLAQRCPQLRLVSPADAHRRGSQVCYAHPMSYQLVRSLHERGVIGDFRAPDIARFGFAPAYLRYADIWDAAEAIGTVLTDGSLHDERFAVRETVT